jgi:phosphotransferase system HPr (HPr) family protein
MHARAAARLVKLANQYQSEIHLARSDARPRTVDAKSIFGVLLLAATQGTAIEVIAEGEDEADAMTALSNLIEGKFGEDEPEQ